MDIIFVVIILFDGVIVGGFISALVENFIGNSPLARLFRLILSIAAGIGYICLGGYVGWGETNIGTVPGLIILLLPVAFIGVLKVIEFMYSDSE